MILEVGQTGTPLLQLTVIAGNVLVSKFLVEHIPFFSFLVYQTEPLLVSVL
jgi:hypothetical protein